MQVAEFLRQSRRTLVTCLPDDHVQIGMTGKFLPFKYYGASGNAQAYGYKEN